MINRKVMVLSAVLAGLPMASMAAGENNIGSCGWGSKLFEGQSGIAPQVLAVTTNGTLGNQTFGITSGTSGCTQDGAVSSTWQLSMFIDGNKHALARDMAIGSGETLDSLAAIIGVEETDKPAFFRTTREHFAQIFPSSDAPTEQVRAALKAAVASDAGLAHYQANI